MDKMTVSQVASYMGVTRTAVYQWIEKGLQGETEKVVGVKARKVFTKKDLANFFGLEKESDLESIKK